MPVEDIFEIRGRGTVATGCIETGIVGTDDEVQLVGLNANNRKAIVTGKIILPKNTTTVIPGDNLVVMIDLSYPVACDIGLFFAIRENNQTIGVGQITELLD